MASRAPNGSNGSDGKPLLPSDLIFHPDGKHLNLSGWLLRNSCWESLRSLSLLFPKIPSEATDYIGYLKFTKSRSNFSWGSNVDDLSARVALCPTPSSPPVQMMVAFLRTRSFVSVWILVLTVAQTLSLQCRFKHVCIHCSQPHKGKARTSVAGSSRRSDKWLPTYTVNVHDSFPLEDASFANLSPLEDCLSNSTPGKKIFCITRTETHSTIP